MGCAASSATSPSLGQPLAGQLAAQSAVPKASLDAVRAHLKVGAQLIDYRGDSELKFKASLQDTISIPSNNRASAGPNTKTAVQNGLLPQNRASPLLCYCASGARAGEGAKALIAMGFSAVVNGGSIYDVTNAMPWHDDFQQLCAAMDTDQDGQISQVELEQYFASQPDGGTGWLSRFNVDSLQELFKKLDFSGDGFVQPYDFEASESWQKLDEIEAKLPAEKRAEVASALSRPVISEGNLALFVHPKCPFAARAWFIATLKLGVGNFRAIKINLANKPSWYAAEIYSNGTLPAIQYGSDIVLGDSIPVCKWIDANMSGPVLTPSDTKQQAAMDSIVDDFAAKIIRPGMRLLKNTKAEIDADLVRFLFEGCSWFDSLLEARPGAGTGDFYFGELSMFEVLTATFIDRWRHVLSYWRGVQIQDASKFPALCKWMNAMDANASFAHISQPAEIYWLGYAKFARNERRAISL